MKKIIVNEVIGNDGNLINKHNTQPEVALSNSSGSSRTGDHNVTAGRQSFSSDYLIGRLGLNFFESEGKSNKLLELFEKIAELEFKQYKDHIKYFLDNLNKEEIKKYKETLSKEFSDLKDEEKESDFKYAHEVLKTIKVFLNKNNNTKEKIDEVDDFISSKDKKGGFIAKEESVEDDKKYTKLNNVLDLLVKQVKNSDDLNHITKYLFTNVDSEIFNITTKNTIIKNLNRIVENKK